MAGRATITFSQAGVQPPVYVVTSLSSPPWETLEMSAENEESESGHLLFTRHFDNVAEGSYQYKIRIGDGHWVMDESKDSATDDSGNRNNVIHVEHIVDPAPAEFIDVSANQKRQDSVQLDDTRPEPGSDPSPPTQSEPARESSPVEGDSKARKENSTPDQLPIVPVPFTVVEKVSDQRHQAYGDIEAESLHEDSTKRVADAEPDFETVQPPSPVSTKDKEPASLPIPTVIVEKTDDKPSFGDDFGDSATSGQKFAHEQRLADASPDEVVVAPDVTPADPLTNSDQSHTKHEPFDDEAAPLFRHESIVPDPVEAPSRASTSHAMDAIEEESAHSSTDHTDPQVLTPDEEEEDNEELSELDNGPLLPHETGFSEDHSNVDELGNAPLLSHETGFSGYEESEQLEEEASLGSGYVKNGYDDEGYDEEVGEADDTKDDPEDNEDSQAPLLPHEQYSAVEDGPVLNGERIAYEVASPISERGRNSFFAARTRTSSLPHTMPRSDEEDDDLNDPSLEVFPTDRESILARVASISSFLPEDQTEVEPVESPRYSVLSNACSSVSLAPRSGSLKSVVEEGIEPEEDIEPDSSSELPSPILQTSSRSAAVNADVPSPVEDAKPTISEKTSQTQDAKSTQTATEGKETSATLTADASEADSVQKIDGSNDGPKEWRNLYDSVVTPSTVLQPPTPPLTPNKKGTTSTSQESEQRTPSSDGTKGKSVPLQTDGQPSSITDNDKQNSTSSSAEQRHPVDEQKDSWLKAFPLAVFDPVGRLFVSCFGSSTQASTTFLVVGIAIAAYYYLYVFSAPATASPASGSAQ